MAKVAVIIAAAGKGRRFDSQQSKVFTRLDGRPVVLRTLERFINREDVVQTLLVLPPDEMPEVKEKYGANLGFMGVQLVEGGDQRRDSVARGLAQVTEEADLVAIHDAVRPCISDDMIDAVFAAAAETGAAILACPLFGTIKQVDDARKVTATIDRSGLFEAQTPQVFRRDLIVAAHGQKPDDDVAITDDAQLVERHGDPVTVVPCDATNLKITDKADLALAAAIIKSRPSKPAPRFGAFDEAQW